MRLGHDSQDVFRGEFREPVREPQETPPQQSSKSLFAGAALWAAAARQSLWTATTTVTTTASDELTTTQMTPDRARRARHRSDTASSKSSSFSPPLSAAAALVADGAFSNETPSKKTHKTKTAHSTSSSSGTGDGSAGNNELEESEADRDESEAALDARVALPCAVKKVRQCVSRQDRFGQTGRDESRDEEFKKREFERVVAVSVNFSQDSSIAFQIRRDCKRGRESPDAEPARCELLCWFFLEVVQSAVGCEDPTSARKARSKSDWKGPRYEFLRKRTSIRWTQVRLSELGAGLKPASNDRIGLEYSVLNFESVS